MAEQKTTQKCSKGNTNLRARNFCVTLNNYTEEEENIFNELKCKYIIIGKEVGENGTPHLQGYIEFKDPLTLSALKKRIGKRSHIEPRRGTAEQASDYCKKDGNFFEKGTMSKQGQRQDLIDLKEQILSGSMTVDDITLNDPIKYHQYGRTINKLEDLKMRKIFRTEMTIGIWYFGETGAGKSHKALHNYHPDTHYIYPNDNGWWDGYKQQHTVVFNDFRGEITFNKLLQLVDKWPMFVKRRNREPIPFTSKKVIITSSLDPYIIYQDVNEDMKQLKRRFNIIEI